jgi:hypothetical protein
MLTKRWLLALFIVPAGLGAAGLALAVHEAGVAGCPTCHTMHNSQDGVPVNPGSPGGEERLLRFASGTDLCLSCHASAVGEVLGGDPDFPPPERGPGNFTFLYAPNINDAEDGALNPIGGHRAGHSVISAAYGLNQDPDHVTAPGGAFPASNLGCTSCHDPHGNQNFRMLRGVGSVDAGGYLFTYDAPLGEGIDLAGSPESPTNHTAYQSGWSEWCANCHGLYHDHVGGGFQHPSNRPLDGDARRSYNTYDGPDNPTGGDMATAYLPEVPLESMEMTVDGTMGAFQDSRVTCISCHRAHATSAPMGNRWDPNVEFLDQDGEISGSYPLPNPYAHPDQRALCVKCHYVESTQHGEGAACMSCHRLN